MFDQKQFEDGIEKMMTAMREIFEPIFAWVSKLDPETMIQIQLALGRWVVREINDGCQWPYAIAYRNAEGKEEILTMGLELSQAEAIVDAHNKAMDTRSAPDAPA